MDESDDYIPKSDEEFDAWQDNFIAVLKEHLDEFGISKEELAELEAGRDEWKIAYAAHLEAQAAAEKAELERAKLTHKGKVDPRERMDSGLLPLIEGVAPNAQLKELTRRHAGTTLRKMMRQEKDHTGDDES